MQTINITQHGLEHSPTSKDGGSLELLAGDPLSKSRSRRHASQRVSAFHPNRPYPKDPALPSPVSSTYPPAIYAQDLPILPSYSPPLSPIPNVPLSISRFFYRLRDCQLFWVAMYFSFNLLLTLYSKVVLVRFPFPYTLTALHALFGTLGGSILARQGVYKPTKLTRHETVVLFCFSILYAFNIVVSNASLHLVTVAFHQVVRAITPIFTVAISTFLLGRSSSRAKMISLSPVIVGVALATYGDYYCTLWGFFLTLFGTLLAALKTILTNVLQAPSPIENDSKFKKKTASRLSLQSLHFPRLHPLDLLHLLSPLAFVQCVLLAYFTGELERVKRYSVYHMTYEKVFALCLNGCIAFGLNVVSFNANKRIGPLGMTVAANVKQVLTILCSVAMFNLSISSTNGIGILLTLIGGAWFARVEYTEKRSAIREIKTSL